MSAESTLAGMIAEAAGSRGLILSRQEVRGFYRVPVSELVESLRELGEPSDRAGGRASRSLFGEGNSQSLGDAPSWIDAGQAYEDVVGLVAAHGCPEVVFCMDPWVGQILTQSSQVAPGAKWILVSDLNHRKRNDPKEYWGPVEGWLGSLPFSTIIPRDSWDRMLDTFAAADTSAPGRDQGSQVHHQKPGAWQWRRLGQSPRPASSPLVFLVRHSGSLVHLRVFLESLGRQDGPRGELRCLVLMAGEHEEVRAYLKWMALSRPDLNVNVVDTRAESGESWKAVINGMLASLPDSYLVLIGDHSILPTRFSESARKGERSLLQGLPLSVEVSAHILTGNLDPLPPYQELLAAFSGGKGTAVDCGRVLSPALWKMEGLDPAARIVDLTREVPPAEGSAFIPLLELVDLP